MVGRFVVTGVTFGVFMAEAMIHYNMGLAKNKEGSGERHHFQLPPPKELAKIAIITGIFSVTSGVLVGALNKKIPVKI